MLSKTLVVLFTRIPLMAADVLAISVIWYKLWRNHSHRQLLDRNTLSDVLLRDGEHVNLIFLVVAVLTKSLTRHNLFHVRPAFRDALLGRARILTYGTSSVLFVLNLLHLAFTLSSVGHSFVHGWLYVLTDMLPVRQPRIQHELRLAVHRTVRQLRSSLFLARGPLSAICARAAFSRSCSRAS